MNPFVVKSLFEYNCIRFGQSAIVGNFNLKHETQLKKTPSNNAGNYTHLYSEVKEKLQPVSFIYAWSTFEHQVKDMYASQNVQGFFQAPQARNLFQARAGPPASKCLNWLH